jgi:hypothetical protein
MFAGDHEGKQESHRRQSESKQQRQPKSEIHRQRLSNFEESAESRQLSSKPHAVAEQAR